MKAKIFIILSLVLFTLSCEERLEEEVYSIQTPDNYYNTPSEGYAGLNAIWGKMNESFGYTQSNLVRLSEALTDNHGGPGWARLFDANINEFQHANFDAKNPYIASVYSGFYQMIFRANSFIDFMEEKDWGEDEPIRKKQIAEAKLYRGLSYFYLVRYFGGLQIATKISDYEEITGQPRASAWAFSTGSGSTATG